MLEKYQSDLVHNTSIDYTYLYYSKYLRMVRTLLLLTFDDVQDDIKGYKNWRVFTGTKMNESGKS